MNEPLPKIFITQFLYDQLVESAIATASPQSPRSFIDRFRNWIINNKQSTDFFGVDQPPGEYRDYIWHVHVAPLTNKIELARWKIKRQSGIKQTSDASIIYSTCKDSRSYLLLAAFDDPEAHDLWIRDGDENDELRRKLSTWAKKFHYTPEASNFSMPYPDVLRKEIEITEEIMLNAQDQLQRQGTNY